MRLALLCTLLTGFFVLAQDPPPKEPEPRHGIPPKLKTYPQATPKKALASAIEACEARDYTYLLAHLIDPGFVDLRAAERGKQFEAPVEVELARTRDFQYANPDRFPLAERIPLDRVRFQALIVEKSRERGFKQLVRDVEQKLRDDPEVINNLKKILNAEMFTEEAARAKAIYPDLKDRAVYFKKIEDRWYLENRLTDLPKKEPGM